MDNQVDSHMAISAKLKTRDSRYYNLYTQFARQKSGKNDLFGLITPVRKKWESFLQLPKALFNLLNIHLKPSCSDSWQRKIIGVWSWKSWEMSRTKKLKLFQGRQESILVIKWNPKKLTPLPQTTQSQKKGYNQKFYSLNICFSPNQHLQQSRFLQFLIYFVTQSAGRFSMKPCKPEQLTNSFQHNYNTMILSLPASSWFCYSANFLLFTTKLKSENCISWVERLWKITFLNQKQLIS